MEIDLNEALEIIQKRNLSRNMNASHILALLPKDD